MPPEPSTKRCVSFIDGQNLFFSARDAFGYTHPNYNVKALAEEIATANQWQSVQVRFYTGIPDHSDSTKWHSFWTKKLLAMSRQGVHVFSRPLRYRNKRIELPDGTIHTYLTREEKGIDVRIALDVIRMAHRQEYDVALIFSQDQDLSEVAAEIRTISREQRRWIKAACAFPTSPTTRNIRGIDKTDWIHIDRATYDSCIDPRDYRTTPQASPPQIST